MSVPFLTVIAGANGCGKSTLTHWSRAYFQETPILDPDAIAVRLSVDSHSHSAIEAGKRVLLASEEYLQKRVSFVVETTLSGGTYLRMMREAKKLGYRIRLIYIGTDSLEINLERVQQRVGKGGHDVPEEDQRRRYPRSLRNLPLALEIADEALIVDNSQASGHRAVGIKLQDAGILWLPPVPEWASGLRC